MSDIIEKVRLQMLRDYNRIDWGNAFGVGKEVIHICSEKALTDDLHFDVKQINTITYKDDNLEELSEKIKHRIIATIA